MGKTRDLFKKTGDNKGTFYGRMGSIKDRNSKDLTEAEEIKKWQEYTEELYKKDLYDPDNLDGVVIHLKSDILEKVSFHGNAKECSKYHTTVFISCGSKIMLKILQARQFPDVKAECRKGRTRDQTVNIQWIIEKAREFQKNFYFCFIDYTKAFEYTDVKNLKNFIEMEMSDHLTCLLRNLYVGEEATIRTGHKTAHWFKNWERSMTRLYVVTLLI